LEVKLAIDTNRYTDFCRGDSVTTSILENAEEIHLPFVVLGELRAGFSVGKYGAENERTLREFLIREGVFSLLADEQTTYHYAAVYRQLRRQGTPIPTNDMWTAALVLQHNLVLCHRDHHFDHLPQIACI
jgi:tRNA(fMet)-specific endonuclease VapC